MFWSMGVLCLCQISFFKMVYVSWIASHLKFTFPYHFYINMTLSRLKSLFMLIFFCIFLFENFWGGCFTCKIPTMYNVYISQEYGKAWYVLWTEIRYCLMLHLRIILFSWAAWWMEFNCSIDIPFLYIAFSRNYTKMQMTLFFEHSWAFLSFSISIFILCICYH